MLSPNARCCLTCVLLPSTRQVETRATGVERETGQREMEHMGAQVRGGGGGGASKAVTAKQCMARSTTPPCKQHDCIEAPPAVAPMSANPPRPTHPPHDAPPANMDAAAALSNQQGMPSSHPPIRCMPCSPQDRVVEVAQPVVEQPTEEYFTKVGGWVQKEGRKGAGMCTTGFLSWEAGGREDEPLDLLKYPGRVHRRPSSGCSGCWPGRQRALSAVACVLPPCLAFLTRPTPADRSRIAL